MSSKDIRLDFLRVRSIANFDTDMGEEDTDEFEKYKISFLKLKKTILYQENRASEISVENVYFETE